ncbi:MAG: RNA methyltransferase [Clostridia bacterium]|nr:RNA methyltransferase [Clostridia bacterium]
MVITGISNEKVKFFRSLKDASGRREAGCFLVEGANSVKDIPESAEVLSLYIKESKEEAFRAISDQFACEKIVLSDALFDRVSDTVTPIGIAAVVKKPKSADISEVSSSRVIVLDHVSDAGNVGAILRTAVAAGYKEAIFLGGADPYSPKAVRASMSAIFKLRPIFCENNAFLCSKFISLYDIIILDMQGEDIFRCLPRERYALVVGNEAHGVGEDIAAIGRKVSIPMQSMESLNAAVSAGIAMYVLGRK